jgi:hypothetical protein
MTKAIRNLRESEIEITGNDREMGRRYLDAERSEYPFVVYVYRAPETRKSYVVDLDDLEELGRIVYAIARGTTEYLSDGESEKYANPDRYDCLCDYGYAYSIWCSSTRCEESARVDVET